ncbi:hypothetical protein G6F56_003250 [Rhizopus delemar]|nr:hypothetical protein G6F56_003250 [Rhizopus delemar]
MSHLSLTGYLWENMNSVQFNVKLLETFTLQTRNETQKKFKTAIKNLKKRKRYNKRTMNPIICKLKKDLDETQGLKRQRLNNDEKKEEGEKEDGSSSSQSQEEKQQQEKDIVDSILEEEHEMTIFNSLGRDESFDSLKEQEAKCGFLDYLGGDGHLTWIPMHFDSLILHKLMRFREINIIGAQAFKILNDIRVLSLSFIFVFGHTSLSNPRLCEYLNIENCSLYCQQAKIPTIENVQGAISDLLQLQFLYSNNIPNFDQLNFTINNTTGLAKKIITNIYNCLLTWNNSKMTESQFSDQALFPLVLPLFAGRLDFEISKFDKTMIAMEDYKPDLLVLLKLRFDIRVDFFVCEIKKPCCSSNKYETDFVKIQREMKAIIDQQIDLGINNPICYGLLVEGYDCYLYRMSLEYEAEYRSHLIAQFRTLRDALDIMLLLPAINILSYLDEELTRLRLRILGLSRSQRNQSRKISFKRPSFKKPVKKE